MTVEPDGTVQTLIECQKDMTEVTHMECKDSGEFAHRETTEYEQTETFNDELVMAERGEEKYVHMKSKNDEYEHMESHMPRKEREAAEQVSRNTTFVNKLHSAAPLSRARPRHCLSTPPPALVHACVCMCVAPRSCRSS